VVDGKDTLYMLDVTNSWRCRLSAPDLRRLVHEWGIHYIKLDSWTTARSKATTTSPAPTAMEAQRIGLGIIRKAVGDDVLLDKDGSVMLNPVGFVDYGRISQDTGHTFDATEGGRARHRRALLHEPGNYFRRRSPTPSPLHADHRRQSWARRPQAGGPWTKPAAAIALAAVTAGMS